MPDLARRLAAATGFRLALRSLALALGGAVLVFFIIHHAAETTWRGEIDITLHDALTDMQTDLRTNHETLLQNVNETIGEGDGLFFAVAGPDGQWRGGNFGFTPAVAARWRHLQTLPNLSGLIVPRHVLALRGLPWRAPDGETLYIAANATALRGLDKLIMRSFLGVFGTIFALGLLGAVLAARSALKRVDGFASDLHEIMEGDLSRRLRIGPRGDEFDRLAGNVNATLGRIQTLMENLRQVTSDISHDLRSPLNRLREHLELSRQRFTGPGLEEMFDEAIGQIDQALEIFTAMLRIAEIEAGARRARFGAVDLSALLAMLAETYEPSLQAQGILLRTELAPGVIIHGDAELLTQLFANLLDNIFLHAHGADAAGIFLMRGAAGAEIVVEDNGPGIPPAARDRVLQRFVRLDGARTTPGHGLGLALAQAVVALHEGSLVLEGEAGLRLRVRFPVERGVMV